MAWTQRLLEPGEGRAVALVGQAEGLHDGRDHMGCVAQGRKRHKYGAICEVSGHDVRRLERQARLPGPTRAAQREEPHVASAQQRGHVRHFLVPANQRIGGGRDCRG